MSKKALALTLILSACVDQSESDIEAITKLAGNSLPSGQFEAANLISTRLTATNLHNMASTIAGRTVLPYVIGCALAAGQNVSTTYQQGIYEISVTYYGEIGLATSWTTAHLTVAQQRMVSNCAMARVNAGGYVVTVSLRGPSTALAVTSGEASSYAQFEGSFFGNVFAGANFHMAACLGTATTTPAGRVCTEEDPTSPGTTKCGFAYTGACADACTTLVNAGNHTYYQNCTSGSTTYSEAVTTHVQ